MSDQTDRDPAERATSLAGGGSAQSHGIIVYGDFNCPFSATAHRRAMQLAERGAMAVEWRCVEHDPGVPEGGVAVDELASRQFANELAVIRDLLGDDEPDVLRVPSRRLNTARLNTMCASQPPSRRAQFCQQVFDAYWCGDEDLSEPARLERFGVAPTAAGARQASAWQAEWESFERRIVPMMRRPGGSLSRGLGALARLR